MAEGFVETNGVRPWYEQRGEPDGAPVVLVMGVGASAIWWPPELVDALIDAGYGTPGTGGALRQPRRRAVVSHRLREVAVRLQAPKTLAKLLNA